MEARYVCPSCGGTATAECEWSGEVMGGSRDYNGPWIECLMCYLQGPKILWERMKRRRDDIHRVLGITDPSTLNQHDRRYVTALESFGEKMFRELKANDPKKGNFLDWKPAADQAVSELEHHFTKLTEAIHRGKKDEVSEFCADLANIAMAIDHKLGAK